MTYRIRFLFLVLFVIRASLSAAEWPTPADTMATRLLERIPVERIDLRLADDPKEIERQLWDRFANKELFKQYAALAVPVETPVWTVFKNRLLLKAELCRQDVASLARVMKRIEVAARLPADTKRILPYGAFLARQGRRPVWIVPCAWERGIVTGPDGKPRPMKLRHIQVWAFSAGENADPVGFVTCK